MAAVTEMHRALLEGRYKGVNVHMLSHEESEIAPVGGAGCGEVAAR